MPRGHQDLKLSFEEQTLVFLPTLTQPHSVPQWPKLLFSLPPRNTQELSVFFVEFLNSLALLKRQQSSSSLREHKLNIKLLCSQERKVLLVKMQPGGRGCTLVATVPAQQAES